MRLAAVALTLVAAWALGDIIRMVDAACGDNIACKIEMETP